MKTTLILRDDLVRKCKARAALRGQPLSRYVEESLERSLQAEAAQPETVGDWLATLPLVSPDAASALQAIIDGSGFREIDPAMWK